ncbi:uncharacterized protein LOC119666706 [Teleopsis dalmanni]|uniref:uncharacterized protein LOC119666706 n=1 Tax=Teleopsis dalmanni TaxID=139649 RepID=UPI0018CEFBAD|nr:uncharacterized protein LOC119666706 [Teleopsis dalmanni]
MVLGWDYKSSEFTLPSTKNKRYCPFECIDLLTTSKDEFGTQRVYKKTSPNCVITLYLPTREITLSGSSPSILRGIVFVDPKAIQGYRVYAQLTLTFRSCDTNRWRPLNSVELINVIALTQSRPPNDSARRENWTYNGRIHPVLPKNFLHFSIFFLYFDSYGREDEEVMGLRFCNEAIMSLHQIWPRNEEPARESLSPLQEALVKRLGDGAHPFTLSLTSQAPPSVQLVPAKRYYGAPIGTSYDVRCFIADKTDEKFHRRASVKMGVRVIYRTDVFHHTNGPENFAALINSQAASPPMTAALTSPTTAPIAQQPSSAQHDTAQITASTACGNTDSIASTSATVDITNSNSSGAGVSTVSGASSCAGDNRLAHSNVKARKSERGDSFPKLRLSPKSFRFSGRFGRSKSEIEKCPNDPFYNYSKSFQEYDTCTGGGPQGAVDKPFLLQDGRVGLRANLDKAWYTHGEDISVTVNIRNDSRKTVRKVRVCAIQHVDVCMFNNGKFKNVVADSDSHSPTVDRTVAPGATLNATVILKPQRGPTKNWIALEDTLQRSTEPDEITGAIAASAVRSPNLFLPPGHSPNPCPSPAVGIPHAIQSQVHGHHNTGSGNVADDRNVFAIYVSYYVKVKLTLSGMGGELSLKLPFMLVHVDESHHYAHKLSDMKIEKLALDDVPLNRKNGNKNKLLSKTTIDREYKTTHTLDPIESIDDDFTIPVPTTAAAVGGVHKNSTNKRRLVRSETIAKDLDEETENQLQAEELDEITNPTTAETSLEKQDSHFSSSLEMENVHIVQVHTTAAVETETNGNLSADAEVVVAAAQVHNMNEDSVADDANILEEVNNV